MTQIVCVTACPTGIAHTYLAAEMLEQTAKRLGIQIKVETDGAMGVEHKLSSQDIINADAVIIAADIHVELERFRGKPIIIVPVTKAISNAKEILQDAVAGKYQIY